MNEKMRVTFIVLFLSLFNRSLQARSPHRPQDPLMPTIITRWLHDTKTYELKHSQLQEGPNFNIFDRQHFESHLLPTGFISFRNGTGSISGKVLSNMIEELLNEVQAGNKTFSNFTLLKNRDLNNRNQTGVVIVKFNDYPFVVKLFIETPESFVNPFAKGFEPSCFFLLGGGTRHTIGFTRIKNLENLRKQINAHPYWKNRISFPRKWHWLPKKNNWIELTSKNLGPEKKRTTQIPAIYALVCDYINIERIFTLHNKNDRCIAMNISNYLNLTIDPHINNYGIEMETHKIIALDTEHFPTMVGYENPPKCTSYMQWYSTLSLKMVRDTMSRTKLQRRAAQYKQHWPLGKFEHS
jgi:hypothetical protein